MQNVSNYSWSYKYFPKGVRRVAEIGSRDCLDAIDVASTFGCHVVAFEPEPNNLLRCATNLEGSGMATRIELRSEALSNRTEPATFWSVNPLVSSNSGMASLLDPLSHSPEGEPLFLRAEVHAARWDSLGLEAPDVLLMDVQGAELKVLEGFGDELAHVRFIVCESEVVSSYAGGVSFWNLLVFLRKHGLRFVSSNVWGEGLLRNILGIVVRRIKLMLRNPSLQTWFGHQGTFDAAFSRD